MEVSSGATTGVDVGEDGAAGDAFARSSAGVAAGASAGVLGGDRAGNDESRTPRFTLGCLRWSGTRWFREHGGMPPHAFAAAVGAVPVVCEREEIAILRAHGRRGPRDRRVGWAGRRRRSRASCGATPPLGRAGSSTGPRTPSGTPTGARGARGRRSWPPTSSCAVTCRIGWAAWSSVQTARRCPARTLRWIGRRHGRRAGPPLGDVVEPGADRAPLAGRLSR